MTPSEAATSQAVERREARRFQLSLPLFLRLPGEPGALEHPARTRNVSFRGLFFIASAPLAADSSIEFVLTLPEEEIPRLSSGFRQRVRLLDSDGVRRTPQIGAQTPAERLKVTGAGPDAEAPENRHVGAGCLRIRGVGRILRVEPVDDQAGVAMRIERYEILPGAG
jgi:PilZ domain